MITSINFYKLYLVIHKVIGKDGMVEETVIDSKGNVTKSKRRTGCDDKEVQVGGEGGVGSNDLE